MIYEELVPLDQFSTLGVGGPARYFTKSTSDVDLVEALEFAKHNKYPVFILGGGSNVVFSDDGWHGIVIKIEIQGIKFNGNIATVGAGIVWDKFVKECVKRRLGGVEKLSAIPGTVGAAPVQNIGAYRADVADTIREVRALDRKTLETVVFTNKKCEFGYRKSIFNTTHKNKYVITQIVFELDPAKGLKEARKEIIKTRTKKGHIAPPEGPRSVGSFFKNPIINGEKLFAAQLIEEAGFKKGERRGNVGISPHHSLVLVTYKGATAKELVEFAEEIRKKIKNRFDIWLDIEPELARTS